MHRRAFLASLAALPLAAALPAHAAEGFVDYKPGVIENALKSGKTVFVDYSASWCLTCRSQSRTIAALMKENPAYARSMTFVRVDWDDYKKDPVTTSRAIPRRSTLIVLRGDKELGRIVAGTSKQDIQALLDAGL